MPRLCLLCERIFGNEVRRGETPISDKMYPKPTYSCSHHTGTTARWQTWCYMAEGAKLTVSVDA